MASERKPELIIVDTLKDKHGRTVKVGYRGGDVEIIVTPHSGHDGRMAFDGEGLAGFIRALAEAADEAAGAPSEGLRDHDARRRAAHEGRNVVEQAARELIGIPDIL